MAEGAGARRGLAGATENWEAGGSQIRSYGVGGEFGAGISFCLLTTSQAFGRPRSGPSDGELTIWSLVAAGGMLAAGVLTLAGASLEGRATAISVEPPPSVFIASAQPSETIKFASSSSVIPTLKIGWRPSTTTKM